MSRHLLTAAAQESARLSLAVCSSSAVGGDAGNLRAGLVAIMAASVVMLALHVLLTLRELRRSFLAEDALETEPVTE